MGKPHPTELRERVVAFVELGQRHVHVHRSSVGRLLHWLGLSHKKSLQASEPISTSGVEMQF